MSFPRRARSGHRNAGIITLSALISLGLLVGCSSGGGATKSDDNASGGGTASADGEIPTYDPIAIVAEEGSWVDPAYINGFEEIEFNKNDATTLQAVAADSSYYVAWNADDHLAAQGISIPDGQVMWSDTEDYMQCAETPNHSVNGSTICFYSSDGRVSDDGYAELFDGETGKRTPLLEIKGGVIRSIKPFGIRDNVVYAALDVNFTGDMIAAVALDGSGTKWSVDAHGADCTIAEEVLVCDNGEKQITAYDLETGEPTMDPVGGEESWVQTFSDGYIVYDSSADDEEAEHTIYAYDGTEKGTFKGFSEELADSVVSHSLVPSSAMFAHREDGPASVDAKGNVVTIRHDRDSLFATTGFNFDDMGEVKAVAADGRFVVMRTDDGYFIVTPDEKTQHEIPGEDFRVFDGHIVIDEPGPEARLLVPNK